MVAKYKIDLANARLALNLANNAGDDSQTTSAKLHTNTAEEKILLQSEVIGEQVKCIQDDF